MTDGGARVLVVDDDADTLFLVGEMLRLRDCDCVLELVSGGAEAAERLTVLPAPAVVLLDVNLADGNGLDLLRLLRTDASLEGIPVVMWSGEEDPRVREEAEALGVTWFTTKPRGLDGLDRFLDRFLALLPPARG